MNLCAVDTDQLNTNLYQLSRAIKSKLTFNKSLIFPEDFISVLSEIDISNEEAVKEVAKQKYVATVFNKQVSTLDNDLVREINNLGAGNKNLTYVNLPNVTYLVNNALSNCQKLSNINLPKVATLGASAVFINCKALTSLYLPSLQSREEDGWGQLCANDSRLTKVYFPIYT